MIKREWSQEVTAIYTIESYMKFGEVHTYPHLHDTATGSFATEQKIKELQKLCPNKEFLTQKSRVILEI